MICLYNRRVWEGIMQKPTLEPKIKSKTDEIGQSYTESPGQPQSYKIRVFYCYSAPASSDHIGLVKVGDTEAYLPLGLIDSDEKQGILDTAARHRIKEHTNTSALRTELHWALMSSDFETRDKRIHKQLEQRLVEKVEFDYSSAQEWFRTSPEIAKEATMDVINGQPGVSEQENREIVLREEQERFVKNTLLAWKSGESERLWDAKMRFGKTLTAFEFIGRAREEAIQLGDKSPNCMKKIFILTHRPVVNDQWAKEFTNFLDRKFHSQGWQYASKDSAHRNFSQLDLTKPFIYFASMQDMRGKNKKESEDETLDQGFKNSNKEIFDEYWDSVIIDEAHEGTLTKLAEEVSDALKRKFTLYLSGTPYNYIISNRFLSGQIDSWDYVQEQKAKDEWDNKHPGEPNAYSGLPKMWINALDLKDTISKQYGNKDDISFDFDKMFECDKTTKTFKNQQDINTFLDTITSPEVIPMPMLGGSLEMPYSRVGDSLRTRHALWVLPSVDACRAMLKVLEAHPYFKDFKVSNVAGNDLDESKGALEKVKKAIGDNPNKTKTITLTVGRLTTGVTVEAWSTVLMLRNLTSAASYMQTIFRVQSPHEYMGSIKTECFVYDFAPDRALTVLAEVTGVAAKAGGFTSTEAQTALGELLNYMPVISSIGDKDLRRFDASELTQALKRIYKEKVLNSGFDSELLFVKNLETLPSDIRNVLNDVRIANGKNGPTTSNKVKDENITVSNNGLDKKTYEELKEEVDELDARPTRELAPEEVLAKEARKSELKDRENMRNILRTISVRIPIMVIALIGKDDKLAEQLKSKFKVSDFIQAFDDESWKEFFQGVTKEMVRKLEPAFDTDILQISVKGWIEEVEDAFEERKSGNYDLYIDKVKNLMARVKNPNKETVFTPYSVVELIYKAAGFSCEDSVSNLLSWKTIYPIAPSPATFGVVTKKPPTFYDINVKSGLFPLYAAVNLVKANPTWNWEQICDQSIYANARTFAGKWITCALLGMPYDWANITVIDVIKELNEEDISKLEASEKYSFISHFLTAPLRLKLVGSLDSSVIIKGNRQVSDIRDMDKRANVKKRVEDGNLASHDTLFDFVISNPPYQLSTAKTEGQQAPTVTNIFQHFQLLAMKIGNITSMIYPAGRWIQQSGKGVQGFGDFLINHKGLKLIRFFGSAEVAKIFPSVEIKDGLSIVLVEQKYDNKGFFLFNEHKISAPGPGKIISLDPLLESILVKISNYKSSNNLNSLGEKVSSRKLYGIESNWVSLNPSLVYLLANFPKPPKELKDPVKILTNDAAGSAGRATWYWTERSNIPNGQGMIRKWQVVIQSALFATDTVRFEIIDNNSAHGRSRVSLANFNTQEEAHNFSLIMQTPIMKVLFNASIAGRLAHIAEFIPDFIDYSKPYSNKDLCLMFGLSEDEISYLDAKASKLK